LKEGGEDGVARKAAYRHSGGGEKGKRKGTRIVSNTATACTFGKGKSSVIGGYWLLTESCQPAQVKRKERARETDAPDRKKGALRETVERTDKKNLPDLERGDGPFEGREITWCGKKKRGVSLKGEVRVDAMWKEEYERTYDVKGKWRNHPKGKKGLGGALTTGKT